MNSQRSTGSRLLSYALVYKYRIIGALAILLCSVGAELAGPFIVKTIIDGHLSPPTGDIGPVLVLLAFYIGLVSLSGVLNFSQSYLLQATALRIIKNMRMDVMRHIQRIPLRYFDNTPAGQIVSRVANDTEAIRELFMSFMATFVVSFAHLLGIYIALFILDVELALYTLALPPIFAVIMYFHLKYSKKYVAIMRARLSDMNAMINESILVMPILQAFRREKATLEEFERLNEDRYVAQVKQFRIFSLSSRNIVGTIGSLVTAFVIWHFGNLSIAGATLSFGVLYAFIDYLGRIFNPIIGIFDQLMNAQRAFVSADKVFAILDMEGREVEETSGTAKPKGEVKFENVTFAYNDDDHVLKNISFTARQGETVALVGHTGSGKSSIINLLLGFYEPGLGRITIDDVDITTLSKQQLRKHMGIVLQDPYLFAGDIKFNVSLYNKEISLEQVKRALSDVGAASFVEQLPRGRVPATGLQQIAEARRRMQHVQRFLRDAALQIAGPHDEFPLVADDLPKISERMAVTLRRLVGEHERLGRHDRERAFQKLLHFRLKLHGQLLQQQIRADFGRIAELQQKGKIAVFFLNAPDVRIFAEYFVGDVQDRIFQQLLSVAPPLSELVLQTNEQQCALSAAERQAVAFQLSRPFLLGQALPVKRVQQQLSPQQRQIFPKRVFGSFAGADIFPFRLELSDCGARRLHQLGVGRRLQQIVHRLVAQRLLRVFEVGVARQDDALDPLVALANFLDQLNPRHLGHQNVGNDEIDRIRLDNAQRLLRGIRPMNLFNAELVPRLGRR